MRENFIYLLRKGKSLFRHDIKSRSHIKGTSLVVQWVSLHTPNAGGLGSIPGRGTRSRLLQLIVRVRQLKIPRATTKTWRSLN